MCGDLNWNDYKELKRLISFSSARSMCCAPFASGSLGTNKRLRWCQSFENYSRVLFLRERMWHENEKMVFITCCGNSEPDEVALVAKPKLGVR